MPVLNQPSIDTAKAVVARMANVMRTRAGGSGSCSRDDLIAAGFSDREIDTFRVSAAKRAQDASIRREDLQLEADRAEIRRVRTAPAGSALATADDLLKEVADAFRLDQAYGTVYISRTPRAVSRAQRYLAGQPVAKRADILPPELRQ